MFSITTDSYIDPTEVNPYIVKVKVNYHNELFKERIEKLAKERHLGLIVFKDIFDGLFGLRRINTVISSLFWCERWKPIIVTPLSDLNDKEFKFASNRESTIFCKSVRIELERFLGEQQKKFEHLVNLRRDQPGGFQGKS